MIELSFNRVSREKPIRCVSLSLRDLESIAKIVFDKNKAAVEIEKGNVRKADIEAKTRDDYLQLIEQNQKMTIFVTGGGGDNLVAYDPSFFQSHLLPTSISAVTIETQTDRKVTTNFDPPNYMRIHFDFSKLKFRTPNFTSAGTLLNISSLRVEGADEAWVVSTFRGLEDRLNACRNSRSLLHGPGIYESGLVFAAFPGSIFLIDEIYRRYQVYFDLFGPVVRFGALAYAFLICVIAYRMLFNYSLWAFPSVELLNDRDPSAKHRKFWFRVITSLIVGAVGFYLFKR